MAKFIVRETLPCYVTWAYEIEAEDEEAAMVKFHDGDYPLPGAPHVGNAIDWIEGDTICDPAE